MRALRTETRLDGHGGAARVTRVGDHDVRAFDRIDPGPRGLADLAVDPAADSTLASGHAVPDYAVRVRILRGSIVPGRYPRSRAEIWSARFGKAVAAFALAIVVAQLLRGTL